jgi:hypothetical protein
MKRFIVLLTSAALTANMGLLAQETKTPAPAALTAPEAPVAAQALATPAPAAPSAAETGQAAAQSTQSGRSGYMQNWIFAGAALAALVVGVVVVSLESGHEAN